MDRRAHGALYCLGVWPIAAGPVSIPIGEYATMACTRGVITYSTLETTWPMIQPSIRGNVGRSLLGLRSRYSYRCLLDRAWIPRLSGSQLGRSRTYIPYPTVGLSFITEKRVGLMDDWLRRERFVFLGWSGLMLFPTAYLALGGWLTGTTFVTSRFTHGLASSYLEGCNALTVAVSTPSNAIGHSTLALWGPEADGNLTRWFVLGGLWTFVAFHGTLGLVGFMLRQFEIARSIRLRPYNALAFSAPIAVAAPMCVGGVATEMNGINYVSLGLRIWLPM